MKVAIVISGQPRNFEKGFDELYKTYLNRYDCDVYFHSWNAPVQAATQFFSDRPALQYTFNEEHRKKLLDLYKPVVYEFESVIQFDTNNIVDRIWRQPLQNSLSMWYSVWKSFMMAPAGYDAYVRTRFDLRYEPELAHLDTLDLSRIHVWDWDTDIRVKHRGYYDVFAVSNYDNLQIYANTFTKVNWYLNFDKDYKQSLSGGWPGQDSGLRNEYLLRWHLTRSGVPVTVHKNTIPHADGHIIR